jgi:HD-GYP domain-containing protein (c-di-GMP phosphodiesterase class II)
MKLSLSKKTFLLIVMLFSVQAVYLYYLGEDLVESVLMDQSRKQALVFLHGLEREIDSIGGFENTSVLQEKIDQAIEHFNESDFSIYRLYIFDRSGKILADSLRSGNKIKDIQEYVENIFERGQVLVNSKIEYKKNINYSINSNEKIAVTDIILPVYRNSHVVAALEVEINIENTLRNIEKIDNQYERTITLLIFLSCFIFILVLWYFLKRNVITPIKKIDAVAQTIADGNLENRVYLKGNDEISHLSRSVNTMAESLQRLLDNQEQAYVQVLQSLAKALEAKDPYTAGHSGRVAKFSMRLGKYLGLTKEELSILKQGAFMHDLGKIAIPDQILNKPESLTDEEFEIMRSHPKKTSDIMKPLRHYKQHREIAAWHHERWDGKGYPDGLKGEQIPLLARIVSIADAWDAMTGDRVYRKGMSAETALGVFEGERDSGQWDPELIGLFVKMMKETEG